MKKALFALFILLLFLVGYWMVFRHPDETPLAGDGEVVGTAPASGQDQTMTTSVGSARTLQNLASNTSLTIPQSKESKYREGLQNLNHVPIEYYGVVVDDTGNFLPGSTVKWSIAYNSGTAAGHKTGHAVTDAQGRFSISGEAGKSLSVIPERTGYKFVATNGGAVYSSLWPTEQRHIADPNKPITLTMHKMRGGEPLVRVNKSFRLKQTNEPVRIDLIRGMIVTEGGDLLLKVNRPQRVVSIKEREQWDVELVSVAGGIQKADGAALTWAFEAPTNGYQKDLTIKMLPEDREWSTSITGGAFINSRNGQVHSKLSFTVAIDEQPDRPIGIEIRSLANTNSSRNWEEEAGRVTTIVR